MKRKIALFLATATAFTCITASAKVLDLNPTDDKMTYEKHAEAVTEYQTAVKHSGNGALHIYGTSGSRTFKLLANIGIGDTLTFWEKGIPAGAYNDTISIDAGAVAPVSNGVDANGNPTYHNDKNLGMYNYKDTMPENSHPVRLVETDENGWRKWETSPYVFEKKGTKWLIFVGEMSSNPNGWYLDDMVCTKSDGSIRFSLDFEGGAYDKETFESNYLKGVSANGSDKKITLSWRNPALRCSDIKVFSKGEDITGDAEFDKEAYALNTFEIDGLVNGEQYSYTISATIAGEEYQSSVSGVAGMWSEYDESTVDGTSLEGWKIKTEGNPLGTVSYDSVSALDGKKSVYVRMNSTDSDDKIILEMDSSNLETGKTYKVTYSSRKTLSGVPTDEWTTEEYIFAPTDSDNTVSFAVTGKYESVWLDNVKIEECNPNTYEVVGDDIAINGSFEVKPQVEKNVTLLLDSEPVQALSAGMHEVSAVISNNSETENVQCSVFAVLTKDGAIVNAWEARPTRISPLSSNTYNITGIDIPEMEAGADYELNVYVWDTLVSMSSLVQKTTYR